MNNFEVDNLKINQPTDSQNLTQKDAFSVQEAAERIGVSVIFLRKKIYAGEIKAKKLGTRTLILRKDFQEMLENLPAAV